MPIYTCLKCGQQVRSKNIATRNSFPVERDSDTLSLICLSANSYIKEVDDEHRKDKKDLMIRISIHEDQTKDQAFMDFFHLYEGLSEEGRKHYLCGALGGHQWDGGDSPPTA